jgi:hypothetical protein
MTGAGAPKIALPAPSRRAIPSKLKKMAKKNYCSASGNQPFNWFLSKIYFFSPRGDAGSAENFKY